MRGCRDSSLVLYSVVYGLKELADLMRENRKTDYRFKLLYAFAIIMVVLDHADGGGLALKTDWYLYGGLPLPLFVFCSGYFYRDADEENARMYIRRKAKTLLIPMYRYTIFIQRSKQSLHYARSLNPWNLKTVLPSIRKFLIRCMQIIIISGRKSY